MAYTSHPISTSGKISCWEGQENQKHEDFIVAEHKSQRYDSCYSIIYLQNQDSEVVLRGYILGKTSIHLWF